MPKIPVKVGCHDTSATLDSGSAVTLVRPQRGPRRKITVACIHGDTRHYPTTIISLITPRGRCQVRAWIVDDLPVPVLMGRDCTLFQNYWQEGPKGGTRPSPRRTQGGARPAWVATELESEGQGPADEGTDSRTQMADSQQETREPRGDDYTPAADLPMPDLSEEDSLEAEKTYEHIHERFYWTGGTGPRTPQSRTSGLVETWDNRKLRTETQPWESQGWVV